MVSLEMLILFTCRGNFDERSVVVLENLSECIVKILGENTDVTTEKKGELKKIALKQDKNATHRIYFRSIQYKKALIKRNKCLVELFVYPRLVIINILSIPQNEYLVSTSDFILLQTIYYCCGVNALPRCRSS